MDHVFLERPLRRPGWQEGAWITLGDGQAWCFPKPWLRCFPARDGSGRIYAATRDSYDADYDDRFDELVEADEPYRVVQIQLELAAELLLRNYDLTDRLLRRLLPLEFGPDLPDADRLLAMWDQVKQVLMGLSPPKPLADGSGSRSLPTA